MAVSLQLELGLLWFGGEVLLSPCNVAWSSLRAQDLIQSGFNEDKFYQAVGIRFFRPS